MPNHVVSSDINIAALYQCFNSFKDFIRFQPESLTPHEGVELYEAYKQKFRVLKQRENMHSLLNSNARYFTDYFPDAFRSRLYSTKKAYIEADRKFCTDVENGIFSDLSLTLPQTYNQLAKEHMISFQDTSCVNIGTVPACKLNLDLALAGFFGTRPAYLDSTLVFKHVSPYIKKADLLSTFEALPGFVALHVVPSCLTDDYFSKLYPLLIKDIKDFSDQNQTEMLRLISECYVRVSLTGSARSLNSDNLSLVPTQYVYVEFVDAETRSKMLINCAFLTISAINMPKPQQLQESDAKLSKITLVKEYSSEAQIITDLNYAEQLIKTFNKFYLHPLNDKYKHTLSCIQTSTTSNTDQELQSSDAKAQNSENTKSVLSSDFNELTTETTKESFKDIDDETTDDANLPNSVFYDFIKSCTLDIIKKLDLCIVYLRTVHNFDFYTGRLFDSGRAFFEVTGYCSVRCENFERPQYEQTELARRNLIKRFETILKWNLKNLLTPMSESHPLIKTTWNDICLANTFKECEERFKCEVCGKMFRGAEFVHKHIKNKHRNLLNDLIQKSYAVLADEFFDVDKYSALICMIECSDYIIRRKRTLNKESSNLLSSSRRQRPVQLSNPMSGRDWDEPRKDLQNKSRSVNFRATARYSDL